MIAHIVHDKQGTINTIVLQGTEVEGGELEIETEDEDALVTTIDLSEAFPGIAVDREAGGSGQSGHYLHLLARDIRNRFRVDPSRKKLSRLE
jgi:hypothetical protein